MSQSARPGRRRWLVPPAIAAVLVAGAAVVPQVASAQSRPKLADITPQALVARALSARVEHFSGTIKLSADLGLPDLSAYTQGSGSSLLSYLSGTHSAQVWYGGPGQVRVAVPDGSLETDLVTSQGTVWLWQGRSYQATRLVGPVGSHGTRQAVTAPAEAAGAVPTPDQVAKQLLGSIGPTTRVFMTDTAWVAGQPVYELGLAPRSGQSTVADALIAVDANSGLPLRVELLARDATRPAISLSYSKVDYGAPAASNFAFTPPAGAKVSTRTLGAGAGPATGAGHPATTATSPAVSVLGQGWDSILVVHHVDLSAKTRGKASPMASLARSLPTVKGPWGQGQLLTTSLVNALLLPDGDLVVGAVTPQALEAAVPAASSGSAGPAGS